MSFIGSMFNSDQGAGFQAGGAPIVKYADKGQADRTYEQTQQAQAIQHGLVNDLYAQNATGTQQNVLQQQQALANQLQLQASGQGPNPILAQLAQATQANTANQAALMAGQRGSSQNAGLIARQAGMQGAANQQASAGQAATLGAQQQLGAQQALAQQQAAMQNVAGNQVGQLASNVAGLNQSRLQGQQNILGALGNINTAIGGSQANQNNANASIAGINAQGQWNTFGNVMKGASSAAMMSQGGVVPGYAEGGQVSSFGKLLSGNQNNQITPIQLEGGPSIPTMAPQDWTPSPVPQAPNGGGSMAGGPMDASMPMQNTMLASNGALVPGQPVVGGDNPKNDTVPAMLSPGEIVIPRSIIQGKNAPEAAKKFVAALLAKQGKGMSSGGYVADRDRLHNADQNFQGQESKKKPVMSPEEAARPNNYRRPGHIKTYEEAMQDLINKPEGYASGGSVLDTPKERFRQDTYDTSPPWMQDQYLQHGSAPESAQQNYNMTENIPEPMPQNVQLPQQQQMQSASMAPSAMDSVSSRYKQGANMEAQAQGQLGKQEAAAAQQNMDYMQKLNTDSQANLNQLMTERKAIADDYYKGKIDPNHFWDSKTDLGKASTVIGLLLGGFSGGLTGGNSAVDFLTKQVERDIDAQKSNMDKKKNMLSVLHEQMGDMQAATNMARIIQMDAYKTMLDKAAAQSKDPLAKARALQLGAQWDVQVAPQLASMAQQRALMQGTKNGQVPPEVAVNFLPKEQQAEARTALEKYTEFEGAKKSILDGLQEQYKMSSMGSRLSTNPFTVSEKLDASRLRSFPIAKEIFNNLSETDKTTFADAMDVGTTTSPEALKAKIATINAMIAGKQGAQAQKLRGFGIHLPTSVSTTPIDGLKPRGR